jgi:hypothetical protein
MCLHWNPGLPHYLGTTVSQIFLPTSGQQFPRSSSLPLDNSFPGLPPYCGTTVSQVFLPTVGQLFPRSSSLLWDNCFPGLPPYCGTTVSQVFLPTVGQVSQVFLPTVGQHFPRSSSLWLLSDFLQNFLQSWFYLNRSNFMKPVTSDFDRFYCIWLAECFKHVIFWRNGGILMKLACDSPYLMVLTRYL